MSPVSRRDFISGASAVGLASLAGNAFGAGRGALGGAGSSEARVKTAGPRSIVP